MSHVVNAESAVLGACLIDPQAYWRVADILAVDDFSTAENRATWEAIGELSRGNVAPDFITVNQANPSLSADALLALSNNTASAANVRGYAGIDGRHRLRACEELGKTPRTQIYDGFDAVAFVVSLNLHRRHMSESQRGMVAAKLANMDQGERTDLEPSANLQKVSQTKAAELLNVSTRTVAAAAKVKDEGTDELVQAVESGKVSVSAAAAAWIA
jgi:hypothetical protein